MLNEEARLDVSFHLLFGYEVVVYPVLLARPRVPGGVRHREAKLAVELGRQFLDERGLAHAAGANNHASAARPSRWPSHGCNGLPRRKSSWHLRLQKAPELAVRVLHVLVEPLQREVPSFWVCLIGCQLFLGSRQALLDPLLRLGPSSPEPLLKDLEVRWGKKDEGRLGPKGRLPHGVRTLHIDIQQAHLALAHHGLHRRDGGAVIVTVHLCMLNEEARLDVSFHLLFGYEVVVYPVLLARPRVPGGVRHREAKLAVELGRQFLDERGLAHAAGANNHASAARASWCSADGSDLRFISTGVFVQRWFCLPGACQLLRHPSVWVSRLRLQQAFDHCLQVLCQLVLVEISLAFDALGSFPTSC